MTSLKKPARFIVDLIKDLYFRFNDDDVPALAAQLAYYFILSFFPFLIFLITIVSLTPITSEEALKNLSKVIPETAYAIVRDVIGQVTQTRRETFLSFSMIATIWASSNGMIAVVRGLNKAYDQKESRPFWKLRGLSVIATVAFALTILFSFVLLILGEIIGRNLFTFFGISSSFKIFWPYVRFAMPVIIMFIVFTVLYQFMPNRRMKFSEVIAGSLFSSFGWFTTSVLFSLYVNNFASYSNTYGSIGGIILLLVWLYWISIIILIGGELNASLAYNRIKHKEKTS